MDEPQEVHWEYWDDFEIQSDQPLPDSFQPTIQATIKGLFSALLWSTAEQLDYLERVLHRLKADDPLLTQARSAIAEERAIRNGEGPVERAGRQAMMDIWDRAPPAVALRLDEIKASLQALKPDSKVRIEGERRLERSPYLELLHDRLMRGEPAYRKPEPGETPTVGDELVLESNGERFTYGITMASPGRDGGPNELLAALSKALGAQHRNAAGDTGGDGALHEIKLRKAAPGRPPNRWRNVYWLEREVTTRKNGRCGPGRYSPDIAWPSRDVAEAKANSNRAQWESWGATYLGAEPMPNVVK